MRYHPTWGFFEGAKIFVIDDTSVYPVEEDFNFFSSNRLQRVVSSLRFVLTSFEPDFDIKKTTLFKILPDRDSSRILGKRG